ncbi:MAG: flagellar FlbD family protein [Deltaproteobacteria bacterium]|nr:flagellar FlbD family protein [Deltaproteobacteria bacterium]MBI3295177.1 flagellar FlbD family protein [Deltaproteobacteria bacterium]
MIRVTRLNGAEVVINADLVQSVENTPDTLITLTSGYQLMVKEPVEDVIKRFIAYKRRSILENVLTDSQKDNA